MADRTGPDVAPQPPARLRALASWQVSKVNTVAARLFAEGMPLGMRSWFAVLAALDEDGPSSQVALGRRLGMDRGDVNGVLGCLEQEGLVRRESDPDDRRRNVVTLLDAGRQRLEELQRYADLVQDRLLGPLDADERRMLASLLHTVLAGLPPQGA